MAAEKLQISGQRTGDFCLFLVEDNGDGFEMQYADKIFGEFQQLHDQKTEGTGIGLAVCKRLVERYGGRIWAQSKPGQGSTFYFSVPAVQ